MNLHEYLGYDRAVGHGVFGLGIHILAAAAVELRQRHVGVSDHELFDGSAQPAAGRGVRGGLVGLRLFGGGASREAGEAGCGCAHDTHCAGSLHKAAPCDVFHFNPLFLVCASVG